MRIVYNEYKKAMFSPIILSLLLLFISFNIFLIHNHSYFKEELKTANQLVKKYGTKMDDDALSRLKTDIQHERKRMNAITEKKIAQTYNSTMDFFKEAYKHEKSFSKSEWKFFVQLGLSEMYLDTALSIDDSYREIDILKIAEKEIQMYGLSGDAAKTLRNEYKKLADRFEELKQNGEHKDIFFLGKQYYMHSFLFKTLFRSIIFEAMILIVLLTAFLTNYEYEQQSHLLVYSTKKGRNVLTAKLIASLLAAVTVTTLLLGTVLVDFFAVFDYSYLSKSAISSAFNWEYQLPYISWWNMSFLAFLLCSMIVVSFSMPLFSAITFVISAFIKNSYIVFFVFALLFGVCLLLPGIVPTSSNAIFIMGITPFALILNPHMWFMGMNELFIYKYSEAITIGAWIVLTLLLCLFCIRRFKKEEMV